MPSDSTLGFLMIPQYGRDPALQASRPEARSYRSWPQSARTLPAACLAAP